MATHHQHLYS